VIGTSAKVIFKSGIFYWSALAEKGMFFFGAVI